MDLQLTRLVSSFALPQIHARDAFWRGQVSTKTMAELARSIVSRMRQFVGDRRHMKRQRVRLAFSLSIPSRAKSLNGPRRISSMDGHTLDLSETGMSLVVPAIRLGEHHLVGENRSLNVR